MEGTLALMTIYPFTTCFPDRFLYMVRDCFYLWRRSCLTNQEEICNSFRDFPEIQGYQMLALFVLDRFGDYFQDLAAAREPAALLLCSSPLRCYCQIFTGFRRAVVPMLRTQPGSGRTCVQALSLSLLKSTD